MSSTIVSVIVPVYNSEKNLRQCIDSITAQTLKDIEIICVNDGSSDNSLAILEELAAKDSRIRVVSQDNAGAGAARNHGLDLAVGDYLSFLDSDDFFEPDMLEEAYNKAVEGNADITVFRSDQYNEDTGEMQAALWTVREDDLPPYRPMYFRTFTDNVFKVFVGWAWDKLFRADFVRENKLRFQELRTSNDMLFTFSAVVLAKHIEFVNKVLAHQRRNNPSSLSNTREKSWDCFHTALIALRDNLERFGLLDELKQDYINYALHFSLWNLRTINGEKKEVLFNKLKNEWFKEFEIAGKPESYFYLKGEYRNYKRIMNTEFSKYV